MNELIFALKSPVASCALGDNTLQKSISLGIEDRELYKAEQSLVALSQEMSHSQNDVLSKEEEKELIKKERMATLKQAIAIGGIVIGIAIGITTIIGATQGSGAYINILGGALGMSGILWGVVYGAKGETQYLWVKDQGKKRSLLTLSSYENMSLLLSDFLKNPNLHPKAQVAVAQLLDCALSETKNYSFWDQVENCVDSLEKQYKIKNAKTMVKDFVSDNVMEKRT